MLQNLENTLISDTDIAVLNGTNMMQVAQNGSMILFADMKTGEFAVKDIKADHLWFSNPQDRETDPYSGFDRANVFSVLTLHCINTDTMVDEHLNSFGSCVMDEHVSVKKVKK